MDGETYGAPEQKSPCWSCQKPLLPFTNVMGYVLCYKCEDCQVEWHVNLPLSPNPEETPA